MKDTDILDKGNSQNLKESIAESHLGGDSL
jgi:hypothetical protein